MSSAMPNSDLTYRQGTHEDIGQIAELLESRGLHWPGPAATPYVAVNSNGEVVAAFFKTLCFHAEPLVGKPSTTFSVTALGNLMRASFEQLADELGAPITVYSMVQDTPIAHAAAEKNGLKRSSGVLYEATIRPQVEITGAEHLPWGKGDSPDVGGSAGGEQHVGRDHAAQH